MHIVLFGAGGNVARRIAREALDRGHDVTGVVRDRGSFQSYDDRLRVVEGDATDASSVGRVSRGADAIVNALSPRLGPTGRPASSLTDAARALLAGAREAGVDRVVVVGGAGSLEAAPGARLVDQPDFPEAYRAESLAQADALEVYRAEAGELAWTYVSPAAEIAPGNRTGEYRVGGDRLLVDADGRSFISFEDFAVAMTDELERPGHVGRRMTVAY